VKRNFYYGELRWQKQKEKTQFNRASGLCLRFAVFIFTDNRAGFFNFHFFQLHFCHFVFGVQP